MSELPHTYRLRLWHVIMEVWTAVCCPKPHFIKLKQGARSALSAESTPGADFTRLCLEDHQELIATWV